METAKVFVSGRSQAVRLPKKYRFDTSELVIQRLGSVVMLSPKEDAWQTFLEWIDGFTEDCFAEGRAPEALSERDSL